MEAKWCYKMLQVKIGRDEYHSGPRGGATSRAINPLRHCAAAPSPVLRIYCSTKPEFRKIYNINSRSGNMWTEQVKNQANSGNDAYIVKIN